MLTYELEQEAARSAAWMKQGAALWQGLWLPLP
jgi:hypothetical protein